MKFVVTEYGSGTEILAFPDHYVAIAVTVDDTGIVADANGKKIVPKGTIVGGTTGSTMADDTIPVAEKNTASVYDTVTLDPAGNNNNIVVTAKAVGDTGLSIALVDPAGNDKALAVSVANKVISVSLATSGAGAITSTAAQVMAAINGNPDANELVVASLAVNNDGTGVVTAINETALAGGTVGTATEAEGVLLNDVDVTYGKASGAMVIHGFIKNGKLPAAPKAEAVAVLKGIWFVD